MSARLFGAVGLALTITAAAMAQTAIDFRQAARTTSDSLVVLSVEDARESAGDQAQQWWRQSRTPGLGAVPVMPVEPLIPSVPACGIAVADDLVIAGPYADAASEVTVTTREGQRKSGRVVVRDHATGLVAIRVADVSLPGVAIASETADVGSPVLLGFIRNSTPTFKASLIASDATAATFPTVGFVQTLDAEFEPGHLGAAVVNADGSLVGVLMYGNGVPICVPAMHVVRLVESASMAQPQDLKRGRLGIALQDNAAVAQVFPDTPAEAAGLIAGDIIRRIGPYRCSTNADVMGAVAMSRGGDEVTLEIDRDDQTIEHRIKLAPMDPPAAPPRMGQAPAEQVWPWLWRRGFVLPEGVPADQIEKRYRDILRGMPVPVQPESNESDSGEKSLREQLEDLESRARDLGETELDTEQLEKMIEDLKRSLLQSDN